VLLTYQQFKKIVGAPPRLSEMLSMGDNDDIEFAPISLRGKLRQVAF
jgi:hypothetical protein